MKFTKKLVLASFCFLFLLEFSSCNIRKYRNFYITKSKLVLPKKGEQIVPEERDKDLVFVRHYYFYLPKKMKNTNDTVALKKYANKVFRRTHELDWKVFNLSHGCKLINYKENEDVNFNFFVRPKRGTRSYTYERKYNRISYEAKWDGSIKKNK
jgi:hypothetical protein